MKKTLLIFSLLLAGCQSPEEPEPDKEPAVQAFKPEEHIITKLEQTTEDTAIRDEAFEKVRQNKTLTGGYFGEVTSELEEEFGVQSIESEAVNQAIRDVYGTISGVGVMFFSNPDDNGDTPGVWVGVKEPDEKFDQFASVLQKRVDEGEILAKYIHLFQSDFTEQENNDLTTKAYSALDRAARSHPTPDRVHFGVSIDAKTGIIEVNHDFLTEEAQQGIQSQFPDRQIQFTQQGRMVPLPGEPDVEYPAEAVTDNSSSEGSWIVSVSNKGIMVIGAASSDFSGNGGQGEYYGALSYAFPDADKKLKIGQRVIVEASGPIMESYPGQGRAKFVTVLSTYRPEKADLTEEEAIRAAIKQRKDDNITDGIRSVKFNEKSGQWTVTFVDTMQAEPVATDIVVTDQK